MDISELSKPFPPASIHWRIGSVTKDGSRASALAYLDSRDVMERLDQIMGPENWQCRYPFAGCCEIGIYIHDIGQWIWKANGAGETKVEAEKGQYSDAFKRAAVLWGIGRYLYDLPTIWVPVENKRFSKETLSDLTARLEKWQAHKFGD